MASTPETKVKQRLAKWLKANGWLLITISSRYTSGIPDCVAISPQGVHWWIEVKKPGGRPIPLQWHWIKKLCDQRAIAVYFDGSVSPEDLFTHKVPT